MSSGTGLTSVGFVPVATSPSGVVDVTSAEPAIAKDPDIQIACSWSL